MKKEKEYRDTRFSADVLKEAVALLREVAAREKAELSNPLLRVEHDDSHWTDDSLEEFLADYRKFKGYAYLMLWGVSIELSVVARRRNTEVSVKASARAAIESLFDVFEKNVSSSRLEPEATPAVPKPILFIGHGRRLAWRTSFTRLGCFRGG